MNYYCTLFDSLYLVRGLSLYRSLIDSKEDFTLYVYCFDDDTYRILDKLQPEKVVLVSLGEFETSELLQVKKFRTKQEYCWTCSSFVIYHCLKEFDLPEVTYLDADIYFFNRPSSLLEEFHRTKKSILLTEHRFYPGLSESEKYGKYCVQFLTFKSDEVGISALLWWKACCIEWCFNRFEGERFGDQKYLDDWLERFSSVYVLKHLGGGVAPWNIQQYSVTEGPSINGIPIVFYHFHDLTWFTTGEFCLSKHYFLGNNVLKYIYPQYLKSLKDSLALIQTVNPSFTKAKILPRFKFKEILWTLRNKLKGFDCVIKE